MSIIPIDYLQKTSALKLNIARFELDKGYHGPKAELHRDDHYIFFLFEKGTATLIIDFQEMLFSEHSIFYVLPGQIHQHMNTLHAQGWYLAVDTGLIPSEFRNVFEGNSRLQQPLYLHASLVHQCSNILRLIKDRNTGDVQTYFQSGVTLSLFQSFAGIVADGYSNNNSDVAVTSRPKQLTYNFRTLLTQDFRSLKTPSGYAKKLNVSVNYLNESIKKTTGFPVSYWISHQVLLEAKRLLFYTITDVKEIAYQLGYDDAAYFSKWFKKQEGINPLAFRAKNLE